MPTVVYISAHCKACEELREKYPMLEYREIKRLGETWDGTFDDIDLETMTILRIKGKRIETPVIVRSRTTANGTDIPVRLVRVGNEMMENLEEE